MNTGDRGVPPDRKGLIRVGREEAIERWFLLTSESRSTFERRLAAGGFHTTLDEETGERLVDIPANAPPTREVQLAEAWDEIMALRRGRIEDRRLIATLEEELASAKSTISAFEGEFDDEVSYREYLVHNLRLQGEDRANMQALIDHLKSAGRGHFLACVIVALVVFLVTASVVAFGSWVVLR